MIYARQVPFDLQESPLWIDVYPENEFPVIVPGRKKKNNNYERIQ